MLNVFFKLFEFFLAKIQYHKYEIYRKRYNIPLDFRFNGKDIIIYGDGELFIGNESYIGSFSTIQLNAKAKVVIGTGCRISHNVRIYTSSKKADYDFSDKENIPDKTGDVIIGNYVWIGVNVFINPGVVVGDNAIIGANSVVTDNVMPFGIYGGVPAKLIRMKNIDA